MIKVILEDTLKNYGITRYELAKQSGIQYQVVDNYYKNKIKRYDSFVLNKICTTLNCEIQDIIKFEKD